MKSKLKLVDEYKIQVAGELIEEHEKYLLYTNNLNYKIFIKKSKIEILKEIEHPLYQKLSEKDIDTLLISLENALQAFNDSTTIEFTGAPPVSKALTILNIIFEEDDEEASSAGKRVIGHKKVEKKG